MIYTLINDDILKFIITIAQDLIKNMLLIDPKERYTIQQVIAHPWLQGIEVKGKEKRK